MIYALLYFAFFAALGLSLFAILWFAHRMSRSQAGGRAYAMASLGFCASCFVFATLMLIARFV